MGLNDELRQETSARLRATGQRATTGRVDLVAILAAAERPLTIPDILDQRDGLAQSSVYRNLSVLEQAHVVRRVIGGDEFTRYELAEDLTEHHHHLVCTSCGTVTDFTIPGSLERSVDEAVAVIAAGTGFKATGHRLDLLGLCEACG
ncbi:MAG: Fur family transcriptional regulator [Acidimicrobiales bacterium]